MRKFEKVSFEQYKKDIGGDAGCDLITEYNNIQLPKRATSRSAGYDFYSPFSFSLEPHETIKIPTGIRAFMPSDEVLKIYIRSSLGFKYGINLSNNVGIVDSDYSSAKNEGHIFIKLVNNGDEVIYLNTGDKIAQGIFQKYFVTDDDEPIVYERVGGIGSTGR